MSFRDQGQEVFEVVRPAFLNDPDFFVLLLRHFLQRLVNFLIDLFGDKCNPTLFQALEWSLQRGPQTQAAYDNVHVAFARVSCPLNQILVVSITIPLNEFDSEKKYYWLPI